MRLDGKIALSTGAARGQGAAAARRFVEEGARVMLTDVLDDQGKELAAELGAEYRHLDVSADYQWVIGINQVGTFLGMRAVVASMTRAGGGSIVNVSSVEGLGGMPYLVAYTASKFAIRGMTKVAAM